MHPLKSGENNIDVSNFNGTDSFQNSQFDSNVNNIDLELDESLFDLEAKKLIENLKGSLDCEITSEVDEGMNAINELNINSDSNAEVHGELLDISNSYPVNIELSNNDLYELKEEDISNLGLNLDTEHEFLNFDINFDLNKLDMDFF